MAIRVSEIMSLRARGKSPEKERGDSVWVVLTIGIGDRARGVRDRPRTLGCGERDLESVRVERGESDLIMGVGDGGLDLILVATGVLGVLSTDFERAAVCVLTGVFTLVGSVDCERRRVVFGVLGIELAGPADVLPRELSATGAGVLGLEVLRARAGVFGRELSTAGTGVFGRAFSIARDGVFDREAAAAGVFAREMARAGAGTAVGVLAR